VKAGLILTCLFVAALAGGVAVFCLRAPSVAPSAPQPQPAAAVTPERPVPPAPPTPPPRPITPSISEPTARRSPPPESNPASTNRVELLSQLRQRFRTLAAGDPKAAFAAAKQLTNDVERETALLALVTEWTHGELSAPRDRASAISSYGLEAGLGLELAKNRDLALLWANEMTQGPGRAMLVQQTAIALLDSDPAAAFALNEQVAPGEQRQFFDAVLAGWGSKDTDAALQWANQLPDEAERDAALQAIRSAAPVGIGAELAKQDGYPIVNGVLPGTPAELGGQLHAGDRIVGLAQGDGAFVDTGPLTLQQVVQLIRGAPGTILQLQILPASAPPDSPPQTISILRDQIKFKR